MTTHVLETYRSERTQVEEFDGDDPLAWILGFASSKEFTEEVLGRHPLHCVDSRHDRFHSLLSTEVLDAVLGTFGLRRPDIRLVRFDLDVDPKDYEWRGLVDPMRVGRLYAEGATVIFGALHDRHEPLTRLCSAFASQAGARTQTNIYLTPPRSQGFKPHWDTHDVFVMQVEGSKHWRIYEGGPDTPLGSQRFDPDQHAAGAVTAEFTMSAGDLLYIPRGVMHAAETGEESSLHITLGLIAYTWSELVGECFGELALRFPAWRENVPFGFGDEDATGVDDVRSELRERLASVADEVDLVSVMRARKDDVGNAFRQRAPDYLRQATAADSLSRQNVVQRRANVHGRMEVRDDRVVVVSAGRELDFPIIAERTVAAVMAGRPLQAGEIDDGLDWPGRQVVLATMLREGLVVCTGATGSKSNGV